MLSVTHDFVERLGSSLTQQKLGDQRYFSTQFKLRVLNYTRTYRNKIVGQELKVEPMSKWIW